MLLFLSQDFIPQIFIPFDEKNHHYSTHVLRCVPGQEIFVFNGRQGRWKGLYQNPQNSKKVSGVFLLEPVEEQPKKEKPLGLFFCPIKRSEWLIEKAVELGVTHFFPIMSHYTQGNLYQKNRWKIWAIEACRQSKRLDIPEFFPMKTLEEYAQIFLQDMEKKNTIPKREPFFVLGERPLYNYLFLHLFSHIFCLHHEGSLSLSRILHEGYPSCSFWNCALIVGPEGGWSLKEWNLLQYLSEQFPIGTIYDKKSPKNKNFDIVSTQKAIATVFLGNRLSGGILRAETAALSGLSLFL